MIVRAMRDDPHTSIFHTSISVIVTNDFGASAFHVYELGSIETISAYDAPRSENQDRVLITLDRF